MTDIAGIAEANNGGYAAGSKQNINYAPSPELVEVLIASATQPLEKLNEKQQVEIRQLRERLETTDGVLHRAAAILGQHLEVGDIRFDQVPQLLIDMVRRRETMITQQSVRPQDPDAGFARIQEELDAALAAGDDERTRQLLLKKRDAKLAAHKKQQEAATRDLLDAAASEAALGDLARTRLEYLAAVDHFQAAVEMLPKCFVVIRIDYINRYVEALRIHGYEKVDNAALLQAIEICTKALLETSRECDPLEWAALQNNRGFALLRLGELENSSEHMEEAVNAFRASLWERTRERVPLDWATTQNNLGNAYLRLGEREDGTALLEEAVKTYHAALQERVRERVPLDWAASLHNLGIALGRLGEREDGVARLEQAAEAFRAALQERTRKRAPMGWAATKNGLGSALWMLGERENDTARLEEAVEAFRSALQERTRERVPLGWAASQSGLGKALWRLGELEDNTARLEEAVEAFRAALCERTRERVLRVWASSQNHLGTVLLRLGERENNTARMEEALEALTGACEVYRNAGMVHRVASFQDRIEKIKALIAMINGHRSSV